MAIIRSSQGGGASVTRLRIGSTVLVVAGVGLILTLAGFWLAPSAAMGGWLAADLFLLGLSLGAFVLLMIYHLTGGRWGAAMRPALAAMTAALPLPLAGMLVPVLGLAGVLSWPGVAAETLPERAPHKLFYLDPTFVLGRTVLCAIVWIGLLLLFGLIGMRRTHRWGSAPSIVGLAAYALTIAFFSTDWMVGLDPTFSSRMHPFLEASGEIVGAFAASIVVLHAIGALSAKIQPADGVRPVENVANVFFGLILLWAYLAFTQWLAMRFGAHPGGGGWFIRRSVGVWRLVLIAVVVLHAILPIACLLKRRLKRSPRALARLAGAVLFGHFLDVVWRILPAFPAPGAAAAMMLAALAGLGGLWVAVVAWRIQAEATRPGEAPPA
jgi:hypothetical protein